MPVEHNEEARAVFAIKTGQRLEREEMHSLTGRLFACKTPNYSPDGMPTFFVFELNKIESYFR